MVRISIVVSERVQWSIVHYLRLNALLFIVAFMRRSGVFQKPRAAAKTHRQQALILSGKPPNLATAGCLSVAPISRHNNIRVLMDEAALVALNCMEESAATQTVMQLERYKCLLKVLHFEVQL